MKKLFTIFGTVLFSMVFLAVCFLTTTYAQNWTQVSSYGFGDGNNTSISLLAAVYNNRLYVGTGNTATGCEVWEYNGTTWTRVDPGAPGPGNGGFGDSNNKGAWFMVAYSGCIYVGTHNDMTGCEIWRYCGATWTQVNTDGFGDANNTTAEGMAVYNNRLYVGTENRATGCEVWEYNGTTWTRVDPGAPGPGNGGFGDSNNVEAISAAVYNNRLYVGIHNDGFTGCELWEYNGSTWSQICTDGFGDVSNEETIGMVVYNNSLYVGTTNETTGCEVWQYNGTSCTQVNADGFGDVNNDGGPGLAVYNNLLYAGTWNETTGCEVWQYDAATWARVDPGAPGPGNGGFGDVSNYGASPHAVYNNRLYVGTGNDISGCQVWQYSATSDPVPDIKANGSDGPISISTSNTLSVTIELDPGDYPGFQADWWVLADTPFGWYYYDAATKQWLPGFHVSYQGALFALTPPVEVLNTSGLPVGTYDFYFGIDGWRNGRLDYPYLYHDSVVVNITP